MPTPLDYDYRPDGSFTIGDFEIGDVITLDRDSDWYASGIRTARVYSIQQVYLYCKTNDCPIHLFPSGVRTFRVQPADVSSRRGK